MPRQQKNTNHHPATSAPVAVQQPDLETASTAPAAVVSSEEQAPAPDPVAEADAAIAVADTMLADIDAQLAVAEGRIREAREAHASITNAVAVQRTEIAAKRLRLADLTSEISRAQVALNIYTGRAATEAHERLARLSDEYAALAEQIAAYDANAAERDARAQVQATELARQIEANERTAAGLRQTRAAVEAAKAEQQRAKLDAIRRQCAAIVEQAERAVVEHEQAAVRARIDLDDAREGVRSFLARLPELRDEAGKYTKPLPDTSPLGALLAAYTCYLDALTAARGQVSAGEFVEGVVAGHMGQRRTLADLLALSPVEIRTLLTPPDASARFDFSEARTLAQDKREQAHAVALRLRVQRANQLPLANDDWFAR